MFRGPQPGMPMDFDRYNMYRQPDEIGVVNKQRMEQGQITKDFQSIVFQMPQNNGFDRSSLRKPAKQNPFLNTPTYHNMQQGRYDLGWCLEDQETEEDVATCRYITDEELKEFLEAAYAGRIDHLFLVKWR